MMRREHEKTFEEKIKRFDWLFIECLLSATVSFLTVLFILSRVGLT